MLVLLAVVCTLAAFVIAFLWDAQNRAARAAEESPDPVSGEVDDADPAPSPAGP